LALALALPVFLLGVPAESSSSEKSMATLAGCLRPLDSEGEAFAEAVLLRGVTAMMREGAGASEDAAEEVSIARRVC
jgi:hypothetical protein